MSVNNKNENKSKRLSARATENEKRRMRERFKRIHSTELNESEALAVKDICTTYHSNRGIIVRGLIRMGLLVYMEEGFDPYDLGKKI